ncbi:LANO_0G07668g1_1 [Lachancea nothofagi CBS 11611]|uniref:4-hydroxy-3-methoxy-5-polyprenylbenzoate decarboxylase n=1 Tax=Lachancea nothofagi CBS 11611 TaxID=1266666 RepID=A0A1G4KHI0_9SACH|nr:LANO_0G07668g1_1 [Lachancea nothofagi CBS 11611]
MIRMIIGRLTRALSLPKLPQRRQFVVATALTLGNFIFGRDARLADAMDRGELYNKNSNDQKPILDTSIADSRPMKPNYKGHIPLYPHERVLLFLVSGLKSYFHPENGENIVQLGEASAFTYFLRNLEQTMLSDKTGRRLLREQPDITSESLDMDHLSKMAPNTLGHNYYRWLVKEGVSPDTRAPVKYINDPTHAYIFKRYRQCHDFYHAVNDLPIIIEGEIAVKALEAANIGVPMAALGALLAPLRLSQVQKNRLYDVYLPWAVRTGLSSKPLINVYWEELLDHDVDEVRKSLNLSSPPDLRAIRQERARQRKQFKLKYDKHETNA